MQHINIEMADRRTDDQFRRPNYVERECMFFLVEIFYLLENRGSLYIEELGAYFDAPTVVSIGQ